MTGPATIASPPAHPTVATHDAPPHLFPLITFAARPRRYAHNLPPALASVRKRVTYRIHRCVRRQICGPHRFHWATGRSRYLANINMVPSRSPMLPLASDMTPRAAAIRVPVSNMFRGSSGWHLARRPGRGRCARRQRNGFRRRRRGGDRLAGCSCRRPESVAAAGMRGGDMRSKGERESVSSGTLS